MKTREVSVSVEVLRTREHVWVAIADLHRLVSWSPEASGVSTSATTPLKVGDTFTGSNRRALFRWRTRCKVTESRPGVSLAFEVTYLGLSVATWRYVITPTHDGTLVTEEWTDRRGPAMVVIGALGTGVANRAAHNETTMRATLANLKADLESSR